MTLLCDLLTLALSLALVTTSLALAGLFAWDASRISEDRSTRAEIGRSIRRSYDAELDWYKGERLWLNR
jgi:hypothetical protein